MNALKNMVQLMRMHQWVKNLFIFLPLFFNRQLTDLHALGNCIVTFIGFSLVTSSIYCFNDIADLEADKLHPVKCKRPIASGAISKSTAYLIMAICLIAGVSILLQDQYGYRTVGIAAIYFFMNLAYTIRLKHYSIVDAFIIALGFVLRIVLGGVSTGIFLTHWIMIMTFLLALFMAFAKRRDDVIIYRETKVKARKNVINYNIDFLNTILNITATITAMAYLMYSVSDEVTARFKCHSVYLTSLFVIAGIFRYLQITMVFEESGSPTKILLRDRFIQLCILGWGISFFMIIYLKNYWLA
jgi:4-hydroxybenzoate polyprenyltransferase